jgi:hypothetical protein
MIFLKLRNVLGKTFYLNTDEISAFALATENDDSKFAGCSWISSTNNIEYVLDPESTSIATAFIEDNLKEYVKYPFGEKI